MTPRYFTLTMLLLGVAAVCLALTWFAPEAVQRCYDEVSLAANGLLWVAWLLALWTLYRSGTFRKSRFVRLFKLLLACWFVVAVARVQHWAFAAAIAPVPFAGTILLYAIWFFRKPVKRPADFLKLAWVVTHCAGTWLVLTHEAGLPGPLVPLTSSVLLFAAYVTTYLGSRLPADTLSAQQRLPEDRFSVRP